jgi:hypothetical protein
MHFFEELKRWLCEITEIALLLIALGVAVGGVVANLTALINTLGQNGLVGLIALAVILFLFYRKKAVA